MAAPSRSQALSLSSNQFESRFNMDERRTLDGLQSARRDQAAQPAVGISLVLPAYNEAEMIEQAIVEADEALSALSDHYEIIVVDDGSRDATAALAEAAGEDSRASVKVLA